MRQIPPVLLPASSLAQPASAVPPLIAAPAPGVSPGVPNPLSPLGVSHIEGVLNPSGASPGVERLFVDPPSDPGSPPPSGGNGPQQIHRIFVPNRGEAASRLIRAAKELSEERGYKMEVVVMYTDVDRTAPWVTDPDVTAIFIPESRQKLVPDLDEDGVQKVDKDGRPKFKRLIPYLDLDLIRDVAKESGADSIWPGWGFKSEDPALPQLAVDMGARFIGPSAKSMKLVGDKIGFKKIVDPEMRTWGYANDLEEAEASADRLGYPVVIKATAGGGGKGIHFARNAAELRKKFPIARKDAERAFGNSTVFIEKAVLGARHVELQMLRDRHGNCVVVGDRECSIQRNNQKIIEEAPAPNIPPEKRQAIYAVGRSVMEAADYVGAATVEGLYDDKTGEFYFLECNARLQVEHTVTEMVTGIDLVKEQIRIAEGHELSVKETPKPVGHAFEVRINAENPDKNFELTGGHLTRFRPPPGRIRVDTGVSEGQDIPIGYDPMLAKLIVRAGNRLEAIGRTKTAVREFVTDGVVTNKSFALEILNHPDFVSFDKITNKWVEGIYLPSRKPWEVKKNSQEAVIAAAVLAYREQQDAYNRDLLATLRRGRPPELPKRREAEFDFVLFGHEYPLKVRMEQPGRYIVHVHGRDLRVRIEDLGTSEYAMTIDGTKLKIVGSEKRGTYNLELNGTLFEVGRPAIGDVVAKANGTINKIYVQVGDEVTVGTPILQFEAMKMAEEIGAPVGGTVKEIRIDAGDAVSDGARLIIIDQDPEKKPAPEGPPLEFQPRHESAILSLSHPDKNVAQSCAQRIASDLPTHLGEVAELLRQGALGYDSLDLFYHIVPEGWDRVKKPSPFSDRLFQVLGKALERGVSAEAIVDAALPTIEAFIDVELLFQRESGRETVGERALVDQFYDFLKTRKVPERQKTEFEKRLRAALKEQGITSLDDREKLKPSLEVIAPQFQREALGNTAIAETIEDQFKEFCKTGVLPPALPTELEKRLLSALAHYGCNSLAPSHVLDGALMQILLAHENLEIREELISRVFHWLEQVMGKSRTVPSDQFAQVLSKFNLLDRKHANLAHKAEGLLFSAFEARAVDEMLADAVMVVEERIPQMARLELFSDQRHHVLHGLTLLPEATVVPLARFCESEDPDQRAAAAEVLFRRYYSSHEKMDFRAVDDPQARIWTGSFKDRETGSLRGMAMVSGGITPSDAESRRALVTKAKDQIKHLQGLGDRIHDNTVEILLPVTHEEFENIEELGAQLSDLIGYVSPRLDIKRITFTLISGENEWGFLLYRADPENPGIYPEDERFRFIHPYRAHEFEWWRLGRHWDIKKIRTPWLHTHLVLATEKGDGPDKKLMSYSVIPSLGSPRVENGHIIFPEVDLAFGQALHSIREGLDRDEVAGAKGRIFLTVRPEVTASREMIERAVGRLQTRTRGMDIERTTLRIPRFRFALDEPFRDILLIITNPGGTGLNIKYTEPAAKPEGYIRPRTEHDLRIDKNRRRGIVEPYLYIQELIEDRGFGPGEFIQCDIENEHLVRGADGSVRVAYDLHPNVKRKPGESKGKVVFGLLTRKTERHPEGIQIVQIVMDATDKLCPLTAAECSRVVAAIDLAEERGLEIDCKITTSGAGISMEQGTENLDWAAIVNARIGAFTDAGGVVNALIDGTVIGAGSYWVANATMLLDRKGVLIKTPTSFTALTGNDAQKISGSVGAEDNIGLAGAERITAPIGQTQNYVPDIRSATDLLWAHHDLTWRAPGEVLPAPWETRDPYDRDVTTHVYTDPYGKRWNVGEILNDKEKKTAFPVLAVMEALRNRDAPVLDRWMMWTPGGAGLIHVQETVIGPVPTMLIGIDATSQPREGEIPPGYDSVWKASTLYPEGSGKLARAISAASGRMALVILANLAGFDGSPESLLQRQLEKGTWLGEAVRKFKGKMVFKVISRLHGGAYVVFSYVLNPNLTVAATKFSYASVIGGQVAAELILTRDIDQDTDKILANDPTVLARLADAPTEEDKETIRTEIHHQVKNAYRERYDSIHTAERAKKVGSLQYLLPPQGMRPWVIQELVTGQQNYVQSVERQLAIMTASLGYFMNISGGEEMWETVMKAMQFGPFIPKVRLNAEIARTAESPMSRVGPPSVSSDPPLLTNGSFLMERLVKYASRFGEGVEAVDLGVAEGRLGSRTIRYQSVSSTQKIAEKFTEKGIPPGTVIVATAQTDGRGRGDHRWSSRPGALYFTIDYPIPPLMADQEQSEEARRQEFKSKVPFAVAAALAKTASQFAMTNPRVKWPNDLMLGDRKLAGILVTSVGSGGDRLAIGVGFNTNSRQQDFEPTVRDIATSLHIDTAKTWDQDLVLRTLLGKIEKELDRLARGSWIEIRDYLMKYFYLEGKYVTVTDHDRIYSGVVVGMAHDGALILRSGDQVVPIYNGTITVQDPSSGPVATAIGSPVATTAEAAVERIRSSFPPPDDKGSAEGS